MQVLGRIALRTSFASLSIKPRLVFPPNNLRYFSSSRILATIEMETVDSTDRLQQLRHLMKENKFDIYST